MPVRVAINGFGRVGRCALRAAHEHHLDLRVVAVNDIAEPETMAQLLARDSVYGAFPGHVSVKDGGLSLDGAGEIRLLSEADPTRLPWDELGVDVVIESTGKLRTRADAAKHLEAGARKVIISAPAKGKEPADATLVLGVNFDAVYDPDRHNIVTNASCTTNCLAPVAKVLSETVGIRQGLMTTIHAYTADQNLLDGPHSDMRRARAAGINLVPTSTGAAKAIGLVLPALDGRLNGFAVRVPIPTGSIVDLSFETERETSAEEINSIMRGRADTGPLTGILAYSEDPIVSSDIVKSPYSAIFDAPLTSVIGGTQAKVIAWYDNEWGYSNRIVEMAARMMAPVPVAA